MIIGIFVFWLQTDLCQSIKSSSIKSSLIWLDYSIHSYTFGVLNLPKNITPFLLIAPAFIVVFSLAVYSLVWLSAISLHDFTFGEKIEKAVFIGLENYQWLFFNESTTFYRSLFLTAIYIGGTLVPELIFGLTIALLLHKSKMGESFFSACLIIPIVLMPSMVGMVARLYFSYDGLW